MCNSLCVYIILLLGLLGLFICLIPHLSLLYKVFFDTSSIWYLAEPLSNGLFTGA